MLNDSQINTCAAYVMERIKHVIEAFGPRAPGSEGERKAQEFIREELEACCDGGVSLESFQVAGKAFFAMTAVASLFFLASVALWTVHPLVSMVLDMTGLAVLYFQLVRYRLFLDPFFPKSTSHNVYGRIRPSGEIRRRVILSGHADAACEWRFSYLAGSLFRFIMIGLFVGLGGIVLFHIAGTVAWLAGEGVWAAVQRFMPLQWVLSPALVIAFFFSNLNLTVPGANDNLTGVFVAVGIARFLKDAGVRLENTELVIASLGSEEAGLRGAKDFAEKHREEFGDVETIFIALETLRDLEYLKVYNRDMNGIVKHDEEVCRLLRDAGKDCGLDLPYASVFLGSSDAAAFSQAGWKAGMLAAMDPGPPLYYHTRLDNWDNMDEKCLCKSIAVVCAAISRYDADVH